MNPNRPLTQAEQEIIRKYQVDLAEFHSIEIRSFADRYRQVEKLIGLSTHSPTEGDFCEVLLRQYLREVMPRQYSVDTGFIRGIPTQYRNAKKQVVSVVASPQIDVLIHDTTNFAPVFRYHDVVVVIPEAVVAVVEVKKHLTSKTLKDALHNTLLTRLVLNQYGRLMTLDRVFFGVFAYSTGIRKPKGEKISRTYRQRYENFIDDAVDPHLLPDALATVGGVTILRDEETDLNKPATCKFYASTAGGRDYSVQLFVWKLMRKFQAAENLSPVNRFAVPDQLELLDTHAFSAALRT